MSRTIALHLPERLESILIGWAEGDGRTVDDLVEIIIRNALRDRRQRAERDLNEARRTLEAVSAMFGKLLSKGPGATLLPADFGENETGRADLMQLLAGAEEGDAPAADMTMLRAAFDEASDQYRRAERILLALDPPARTAEPATAGHHDTGEYDVGEDHPPVQVGRGPESGADTARPAEQPVSKPAGAEKPAEAEPEPEASFSGAPTRFRAARLFARTTG